MNPQRTNQPFELGEKAKAALKALEKFNQGGQIDDVLLEGFTQHGNWIGIYECEEIGKHSCKILGHILEKSQCTRTSRNGDTHLLTSYRNIDKGPKVEIPYTTIAGSICAPMCRQFFAPNLIEVRGKIEIDNAHKIHMPLLKSVGGFINLGRCHEINLPSLNRVGKIINAYRAKNIDLPKLKEIEYIKFPNIKIQDKKKIIGRLTIDSLKGFKDRAYEAIELQIIQDELAKRKIIESIKIRGSQKEISLI